MLKAVEVNLDMDEMIIRLEKASESTPIEYTKLNKLVLAKEPVRKMLWVVDVRTIEVYSREMEEPFMIASDKVRDFDKVEDYLLKIADKYDVEVSPMSTFG